MACRRRSEPRRATPETAHGVRRPDGRARGRVRDGAAQAERVHGAHEGTACRSHRAGHGAMRVGRTGRPASIPPPSRPGAQWSAGRRWRARRGRGRCARCPSGGSAGRSAATGAVLGGVVGGVAGGAIQYSRSKEGRSRICLMHERARILPGPAVAMTPPPPPRRWWSRRRRRRSSSSTSRRP